MKNRSAILAAAILTSLVGAVLFLDHAPAVLDQSAQLTPLTFDRQITGNSQMLGSPGTYTVIALPENYQADSLSQEIIKDFASDEACLDLRKSTEVVTMTASNPLLSETGPLNTVAGTYPMVCVLDGDRCVFKRSGKACVKIGTQLASAELKFGRPCPSCPLNKPKPDQPVKPEVPAIPDTPVLPDTPTETPADDSQSDFVLFAVLAGGAFAMVRYFQS